MIRPDLDSLPIYVPGARMEDALKLSSNEVSQPPLPSVAQAMNDAAANANRYPDMGAIELREALASRLGFELNQVTVGTGSSALCQQLVQATCDKGDEVVFPWRSFEAYPIFAQIHGATPVAIPLKDEALDMEAMKAAVTDKTRLVFLCNPNNPTGTTITREQFTDFMAAVPADVVVALDEAYFEYNRAENTPLATDAAHNYPNVVGLRTFSKAYGLAGARVGYAFGPENIITAMQKVAVPFSVSSIAQAGALAALRAQDELNERVEETAANRDRVSETIGAIKSEANFVWLPGAPREIGDKLAEKGVLVRCFPEGIRVTVTTQEESDRLIEAWNSL